MCLGCARSLQSAPTSGESPWDVLGVQRAPQFSCVYLHVQCCAVVPVRLRVPLRPRRVAFLRQWLRYGEPYVVWLPGLFDPHGFITGTLQAYARQFRTSVDVLGLAYTVLDVVCAVLGPGHGRGTEGVAVARAGAGDWQRADAAVKAPGARSGHGRSRRMGCGRAQCWVRRKGQGLWAVA